MKRTYQPKKRRRVRRHGFLASKRKSKVINRRRNKGRAKLAATASH